MSNLETLLTTQLHFAPVIPIELQQGKSLVIDVNDPTQAWQSIDIYDLEVLIAHTQKLLKHNHAVIGLGRYAEDRRLFYTRDPLFQNNHGDIRSVHLGIDLTVPATTPVYAPLSGTIHSATIRDKNGDYGGLIILSHQLQHYTFYTLYGHLDHHSVKQWQLNQKIESGQQIGYVANHHENGHWPPHLHFQVIKDLMGYENNFPGVAAPNEAEKFLSVCLDPNLILRIPH